MKRFEGMVTLITGGSSGIGQAAALAFAREGANVVIGDIESQAGVETARKVEECGTSSLFVQTDVSKSEEVLGLVHLAAKTFGRLDCAVNNAGILGELAGIADQTEEDFDRTINVNLNGVWLCMKYEISEMLKQGSGAIVNISSINGIRSASGAPIYSASKHAVIGLTKSAAIEYGSAGIRINALCPGAFPTRILEKSFGGAAGIVQLAEEIPLHRIGRLEEIAGAILWLCSADASYFTGSTVVCDGGLLAL